MGNITNTHLLWSIAMKTQGKRLFALFTIITAYYLTLFDWELPVFSKYHFNWSYAVGMVVAMVWVIADRFLKHVNTPEYEKKKLLLSHFVIFIIFAPAIAIIVLPALGPTKGVWSTDYKLAFLTSYFLITAGPKIPANYERFLEFISSPKNGQKNQRS
jgi:hypothetical protein